MSRFTTKTSTKSTCGQCRCPIWILTVHGLTLNFDIEVLTIADEVRARLAKRTCVQVRPEAGTLVATFRNVGQILRTAGADPVVLAEHKCHVPTTKTHPTYFPPKFLYDFTEEPRF